MDQTQPQQDLGGNDINESPDLKPVELPGRDLAPTMDERLSLVESVLNIT